MQERNKLLKRLQVCDFVLIETALYLDTHPNDQIALEYYQKHLQMQRETKAEYVSKYGPISMSDYNGEKTWRWIEEPWPWEIMEAK